MFIYSYKTKRAAISAIFKIFEGYSADISFLSGKLSAAIDLDALDITSLPVEVIAGDVKAASCDDLFMQYEDSGAKGIFLSFNLLQSVVFRLIFFGESPMLVISVLAKTHLTLEVPDDIEVILKAHGMERITDFQKSLGDIFKESC